MRSAVKWLVAGVAAQGTVVGTGQAQVVALDRVPSRFASYQNLRIHYKSFGVGRTAVVFVHGWAGDLTVWTRQVEPLDGRTRLLLLDLPGHGRSDAPNVRYTMDLFAGAVDAVMQAAQVDRAVLVGHSLGTPVIRQFYRRYPAKTVGLVAVDGALKSPGLDSAAFEKQAQVFAGPGYRDALERMTAPMFPADGDAAIRRHVIQVARATPQHVVLGAMRSMFDPAIWTDDPIGVPLLVVVSKKTGWPATYHQFLKSISSDLRYEELDGVNHFLMLERPDLFNPILGEFVASLGLFRS
jgi:pimeloyl-ACP methyl ester carboxylesterase